MFIFTEIRAMLTVSLVVLHPCKYSCLLTFSISLQNCIYRYTKAIKLKLSHYMPLRCLGGEEYSSYSFSTSALDGGEWSALPWPRFNPGKERPVRIVQEAGWTPDLVWTQGLEEKSFRLCRGSNLDLPVVQPVARHYTD
jgi:hypothetical protein